MTAHGRAHDKAALLPSAPSALLLAFHLVHCLLVHGRQRPRRVEPRTRHQEEDAAEDGRRGREGSEGDDEELLDEAAARLSEGVADHVDGGLALGLLLRVQRDVRHLLARVKQGVLGGLGEDVLSGTDEAREHERSGAQQGGHRSPRPREQNLAEEDGACGKDHKGRDRGGEAPAQLGENEAAQEHRKQGHSAGGGGECAHEG
mmetsp:Transcript_34463/g.77923  ORF Transcript_34463/g.77923 Transcript_34463/m.77923 type:complete len:203 (-) Transcript_34463:74-682(-)